MFHGVTVLTLVESARTLRLTLWDEDAGRLIPFSALPRAVTTQTAVPLSD
jgi:hypothetical protein